MPRAVALRLVIFVAVAVHMQLGGIFEQVLGKVRPAHTMTWRMYASPGRDVCEVSWFRAEPDGLVPINRLGILGYEKPWKTPYNVKLLHGEDHVRSAARTVCGKLLVADVRAEARCGGRGGRWKSVITTDEALCDQPAPPPRRKRSR